MTKTTITISNITPLLLSGFGVQQFIAAKAIEAELAKAKKVELEIRQLEENLKTLEEPPADIEAQIEELKKENRELHRLRSEVRQLRQKTNTLAQLKERNQQLMESVERSQEQGSIDIASLGFVSKEQWTDAGLKDPESTVKTIFHYLSKGDLDALVARSAIEDESQNPLNTLDDEKRSAASETMRDFTQNIHGFRIAKQDQNNDHSVTVHIQTALDGEAIPVSLQKVDQQWKIDLKANQMF